MNKKEIEKKAHSVISDAIKETEYRRICRKALVCYKCGDYLAEYKTGLIGVYDYACPVCNKDILKKKWWEFWK